MSNTAQIYTIPVVGHFEKVSLFQFQNAMKEEFGRMWDDELIELFYNQIVKPQRGTDGSAGYDMKTPFPFILQPGQVIKIPTGIYAKIQTGWFLGCLPRSGLGFKYSLHLVNTCAVVDSDYEKSDNEGHIFIKIINEDPEKKTLVCARNDGVCQGIYLPFGITDDDCPKNSKRNGGEGSTGR